MALNVDLSKMSYDEFKTFMMGLATLYSDVDSNYNFISLYKGLKSIAKRIDRLAIPVAAPFAISDLMSSDMFEVLMKLGGH